MPMQVCKLITNVCFKRLLNNDDLIELINLIESAAGVKVTKAPWVNFPVMGKTI